MQADKPTATATVVPHRPLLLLLLWSLTGLLTPALAQDHCNDADDIVLGGGQEHIFPNKKVDKLKAAMTLFLKRESSSAGFTVNVRGTGGIQHSAWFPVEEKCFPDKDTWYELQASAEMNATTLRLYYETGTCKRICEKNKAPESLLGQTVVAQGASRWRTHNPPKGCARVWLGVLEDSQTVLACYEPAAPMATMTIIIITIVVFLIVVGVLVAAVRLIEKKKLLWAKSSSPPDSPPADETSCAEDKLQDHTEQQQQC